MCMFAGVWFSAEGWCDHLCSPSGRQQKALRNRWAALMNTSANCNTSLLLKCSSVDSIWKQSSLWVEVYSQSESEPIKNRMRGWRLLKEHHGKDCAILATMPSFRPNPIPVSDHVYHTSTTPSQKWSKASKTITKKKKKLKHKNKCHSTFIHPDAMKCGTVDMNLVFKCYSNCHNIYP